MQLYLEVCWIYWDFFLKKFNNLLAVRSLTVPETEFHNFSSPVSVCLCVTKTNGRKWDQLIET